jgi:deoxyribodipyrimidine photo-lyase
MIHPTRIEYLNSTAEKRGRFIVYWMQQSQRAIYNHALEFAIDAANERNLPLIVFFGLTSYPEANLRHYWFMLQGLKETRDDLNTRGIKFVVVHTDPDTGIVAFARDASLVVTDMGYLRIQREWRKTAAEKLTCPLIQVESDVLVPIRVASIKEEFSAGTLRPKLTKQLREYLVPLQERTLKKKSTSMRFDSLDISDIKNALADLSMDMSVTPVKWLNGGTSSAEILLREFIHSKLDFFATRRNDPSLDYSSNMSPYLHFGQISPLYIAMEISRSKSPGKDVFLEEMIVRRELSMNFVWYSAHYDTLNALPNWAQLTLNQHKKDKREPLYSVKQLENAQTYDPYWNAAQKEMVIRGKMHGYMRMYWGKKIIEWTANPEEAYRIALYLNNKYEIDGRDANGFTGVAWCFGKHDRAWKERSVFGKVRYMNDKGLERKFNIEEYVRKIDNLESYA